jgi:hypothetical protein
MLLGLEISVISIVGELTVTCVVPDIPANVAVIVEVPAVSGLVTPAADTDATAAFELVHIARSVTSRVVESEKVAVAVSWVGAPRPRFVVTVVGVTATELS